MCRCEEALELISRQLDETLSPAEAETLSDHLASCEECRALALELRELHEAVSGLSEPAPEGFTDSVMARIRQENSVPGGRTAPPRKLVWSRNWRVWSGLAAAVILIAFGTSRLNFVGMGSAASGSSAAAPAALTGSADAPVSDQASEESGGEASDAGMERSFTMSVPEPEEPSYKNSIAESQTICGYGGSTADGADLTAEEAGYKVLETAVGENVSVYESTTQDESLAFVATAENGNQYNLVYTGMSDDGCLYQFTLTVPDGTVQSWSVTADGSEVSQDQ